MAIGEYMKCEINSAGKPVWSGVSVDSPFSAALFYNVDMGDYARDNSQMAFHSNLGSITVLHRMTGFGYMDTESGYRDPDGKFWLASGMINVAMSGSNTVGEAIDFIKSSANTCTGE